MANDSNNYNTLQVNSSPAPAKKHKKAALSQGGGSLIQENRLHRQRNGSMRTLFPNKAPLILNDEKTFKRLEQQSSSKV